MLSVVARADKGGDVRDRRLGVDLHEQTGLSAGAVTDNYELATDLGHGDVCRGECWGIEWYLRWCWAGRELAGEMEKGWLM